jgi:ligand-binding SRPBCC domain-containing protein
MHTFYLIISPMVIKQHSGIYTLYANQELNMPINEAWDFFSVPENLAKITPQEMGFEITSDVASKAYTGQIITYKVGLLPLIKASWVTEITHVEEGVYFVDEQRFGPYKMWHHEHWFESLPNGNTLIKDKISYKLPLGILGKLAQIIMVKRKLIGIFSFREKILTQKFNS